MPSNKLIQSLICLKMGQQIALEQKKQISGQDLPSYDPWTGKNGRLRQNQGFLKADFNPFQNSVIIGQSLEGISIYVEKCVSLHQHLTKNKNKGQFLSQKQILNLCQSLIYTLARLQQQNVLYKDVCSSHVFFVKGKNKQGQLQRQFKLLPNELIGETSFQRLLQISKQKKDRQLCFTFSPEMIIAYRAKQKGLKDVCLVKKSSIFALGIVILQISSLKTSSTFYDIDTLDIYSQQIEQSLMQVQWRYGQIVTKLIANMLDFDFEERIQNFTQLAKWLVYELNSDYQDHTIDPQREKQYFASQKYHGTDKLGKEANAEQTLPICLQSRSKICSQKQKENKSFAQSIIRIEDRQQKLANQSLNKEKYDRQNFNKENFNMQNWTKSKQSKENSSKWDSKRRNMQKQKKIEIKQRQVSVYLQKKIPPYKDRESKSRLIYSPFQDSNRSQPYDGKSSKYLNFSNQNYVMKSSQRQRRVLAFQSNDLSQISKKLVQLKSLQQTTIRQNLNRNILSTGNQVKTQRQKFG